MTAEERLMERRIEAVAARIEKKKRERRYVTADTLSQYVETLTKDWLEKYGSALPRTRHEWDADGVHHVGRQWLYPLHEILDMVDDGRITRLVCK